MKKTLVVGGSYTGGCGLKDGINDPQLWVNQIHTKNNILKNTVLNNCSVYGATNTNVYKTAVNELVKNTYEYAFIVWTSMPKFRFHVGLEKYNTEVFFTPGVENTKVITDINTNKKVFTKSYLCELKNKLMVLQNKHYNIVQVLEYVDSLYNVARRMNTKIYFINGLCQWDEGYFDYIDLSMNNIDSLTSYTKKILNIRNRDDSEIIELYNIMHSTYSKIIHKELWLNLNKSLRHLQIDMVSDDPNDMHPGIKSQYVYTKYLLNNINELLK